MEGNLRSKFLGALLGTGIGDALGMPVEGLSATEIAAGFGAVKDMMDGRRPMGSYTDDTEMMIGVAQSLIECRGFNAEHMKEKFMKNYDEHRGYGPAVKLALGKISSEKLSRIAPGRLLTVGYLNGAAMRIAPISAFYHDASPEMLRKIAYESSMITHDRELGHEGAALQAYAIACAVNTKPATLTRGVFLRDLVGFVRSREYKGKLSKVQALMKSKADTQAVAEELGVSAKALESIPAAIYSFLVHHEDFGKAVLYAVNLGGDADTIAAMTGAISGAYLGVEAIPLEWRQKLENVENIKTLAERLLLAKRGVKIRKYVLREYWEVMG